VITVTQPSFKAEIGGFFVMPPLLDRIDRVGKIGIMGW